MKSTNSWTEKLANISRRVYLFAARGPVYHYTYGRWRLNCWLNSRLANTAPLDDQSFLAQLDLDKPELLQVKQAAAQKNYEATRTNISAYFKTRMAPQFFFKAEDMGLINSLIDSEQKQATIQTADQICQNIFYLRRVPPVKFEDGVDWIYCPNGNIDWTWDLNRHTYFETLGRAYAYTGDERYVRKFRELLLDWLANNSVGLNQKRGAGVFEVAFRINTWLWAFYYFRTATAFDDEICIALLKGLLRHGHYLDAHLELHTQNNHLLLEAKSLAMLGIVLPEFKPAKKWRRRGLRILYQQIKAQVCSDGVHGERTTFYHQVIAGELLELLVLLENNQISVPPEIVQTFSKMVEFELWVTKPNGLIPLLSDSSFEDTYPRFSAVRGGGVFLDREDIQSSTHPLDEKCIWLLGHERINQYLNKSITQSHLNSRAFPEGGYFVMRQEQSSEASYLVFDAGPFGYKHAPGHGHADALSFELYACGQTLLTDSGFYGRILRGTPEGNAWRNFFRSSRAHNTVVVDEEEQSVLVDTWRVHRQAQTTVHQWLTSNHFDFVDASHNGYERLTEPITHRRQIFFVKPEYWIVIDLLNGQGEHCFDLYFHLMPDQDTQLESESCALYAGNGVGPGVTIVPLTRPNLKTDIIAGATIPVQGWVAFFSGEKQPAPTLRYRQVDIAPVQFCTVLYPNPEGRDTSVTVSPLKIEFEVEHYSPVGNRLTGLQIETDDHIDYLVLDRESDRMLKSFAGYETDAQLIYLRHKKEDHTLSKVIMRCGSRLFALGQSVFEPKDSVLDFIVDCEV